MQASLLIHQKSSATAASSWWSPGDINVSTVLIKHYPTVPSFALAVPDEMLKMNSICKWQNGAFV